MTNPPLPAALVSWAVGRAVGAKVVLDTHPGGFGAQGDRVAARLQTIHRWLAPRVDFSMVASSKWQSRVESWGGDALVVHEAPGDWSLMPPARHGRLRVLYVGRFAADEPWEAVIAAAAAMPWCDVHITGDPTRAGVNQADLPENVRLVGYLDAAGYRQAVTDADVVLCLTTEPGSVMRSAYEAVWAGRPLIVSDWPVGREIFPYAIHVPNDADGVVAGVTRARAELSELISTAVPARLLQRGRWDEQLAELTARLT